MSDATDSVPDIPDDPQEGRASACDLAGVSTVEYAMVYEAEKPRLVRYLIQLGANYHDADDAAQRALTQLYEKWTTVRHPKSWLRKVASRELGRANITNENPLERHDQLTGLSGHTDIDSLLEEDIVLLAIRQLPLLQRQVFALRFDQFETKEISAILQITEAAVRQNLVRARARLKEFLQRDHRTGQDGITLELEGGI